MTLTQAAAQAGLRSVALRAAIANGRLTATKYGRDWLVTQAALDAYLESRPGGRERKPYGSQTAAQLPSDT